MTIPVGPSIDRVTYRGRSAAIRVQDGPVLNEADHRYPVGADLSVAKYRGRGKPVRVGFTGVSALDDFNDRDLEGLLGCTSRAPHYRYSDPFGNAITSVGASRMWPLSPAVAGPQPFHVGGDGTMRLQLPEGCWAADTSVAVVGVGTFALFTLKLPISKTDNMTVEYDIRCVTPDLIPPDGVADGFGTNLQATFSLAVRGTEGGSDALSVFLGELVQAYAYGFSGITIFRAFCEFDQGDSNIDSDVDLVHPFKHGDFRRGVHVKAQSTRIDSANVRVEHTVSMLDETAGLHEYTNSTVAGADYAPAVASRTFTKIIEWVPAVTAGEVIHLEISGSCRNGGSSVIAPYDGLDFYWQFDNLTITTNDWSDAVVPTC